MVAQTRSLTIVTTNTEAEALLLEAQLIKRFRPAYNVLLRDDKSFPFILLRDDHAFPRVMKHRGARRHKGSYFGPFASAGAVTQTRSEEHTSELQSLMRISYAVFCLKKKKTNTLQTVDETT